MPLKPQLRKLLTGAVSVVLGLATCETIDVARARLPARVAEVIDLLAVPGALLGLLLTPGGVHGGHAALWAMSVIVGNIIFYSGLWWAILVIVDRVISSRSTSKANGHT